MSKKIINNKAKRAKRANNKPKTKTTINNTKIHIRNNLHSNMYKHSNHRNILQVIYSKIM